FDGDGLADLAIGAPDEDLSEADEGAVHILFGAESGVTASGDQLWYRNLLPPADFSPTNIEDHFGAALATGDFDGNGHADLAIGAPGEALTTPGNAGAVFTLHGSLFADDFELGDDSRWSTSAP
ncbi:MAG: integrin alpha, partial [Thermoanaerobaculia bacterium]|nr:integrin alpha [Thermoanaerobaculia bacterium]